MKIAIIVTRVLLGLLLVFSSVMVLFNLAPQPELHGNMKILMEGFVASVYIIPVVKVLELLCGIAFLAGRYVALAAVVIFPIVVNIVLVHVFVSTEGLPMAIFLLAANLFLAYAYRKNYEGLLSAKQL